MGALGERRRAGDAHQEARGAARRGRRLAWSRKQLRQVQDEWHKVRAVPREKGRELWQRYKTVEGEIRARCESFFQQVAVERTENLRLKESLCEQVEALADSTDWIRTAETIKALQAQWKTIGPVTPGHEKAIWERFRAACDRFFTRRKLDLSERKAVWTANLQKKEAICAQIETLGGHGRLGSGDRRGQAPPERLARRRPGEAQPRGSAAAAVPRRVRDGSSSVTPIATTTRRRSRPRRANRSASTWRRSSPAAGSRRSPRRSPSR